MGEESDPHLLQDQQSISKDLVAWVYNGFSDQHAQCHILFYDIINLQAQQVRDYLFCVTNAL